jgi:anaerobic selenocysteine-containing dehydrogenase
MEAHQWDEALDRIADLMKGPRRQLHREERRGKTVNRWLTTGFLAASAASNEAGYITHKVIRPACWGSITRRVSDTARRWQVLPRRTAVAR